MNTKFYLVSFLALTIGAISLSFKNSPSSRCELADLAKPGGGAIGTNQGLTGASWDNEAELVPAVIQVVALMRLLLFLC